MIAVVPFHGGHDDFALLLDALVATLARHEPGLPVIVVAHDVTPACGALLETLASRPGVEVLRAPDGAQHAHCMLQGWRRARARGFRYVWQLDSDCVVLRPCLAEALARFGPDVVAVSDFYGAPTPGAPATCGRRWLTVGGARVEKCDVPVITAASAVGYPATMCAVFDLGLAMDDRVIAPMHHGWPLLHWFWGQGNLGRQVAFYPFLQQGPVAHLGAATVRRLRGGTNLLGNALTTPRYGQKHVANYYAGWWQVPDTDAYWSRLRAGAVPDRACFAPPPAWTRPVLDRVLRFVGDDRYEVRLRGEVIGTASIVADPAWVDGARLATVAYTAAPEHVNGVVDEMVALAQSHSVTGVRVRVPAGGPVPTRLEGWPGKELVAVAGDEVRIEWRYRLWPWVEGEA